MRRRSAANRRRRFSRAPAARRAHLAQATGGCSLVDSNRTKMATVYGRRRLEKPIERSSESSSFSISRLLDDDCWRQSAAANDERRAAAAAATRRRSTFSALQVHILECEFFRSRYVSPEVRAARRLRSRHSAACRNARSSPRFSASRSSR